MTLPFWTRATVALGMGKPSVSVTVPWTVTACRIGVEKQKAGEKQGAAIAPQRKRHSSSVPLGTRFEAQGTGLLTCAELDYLPGAAAPVVAAIPGFPPALP